MIPPPLVNLRSMMIEPTATSYFISSIVELVSAEAHFVGFSVDYTYCKVRSRASAERLERFCVIVSVDLHKGV